MSLADKKCIPCRGGVPPLPAERTETVAAGIGARVVTQYPGPSRAACIRLRISRSRWQFANKVGAVAEAEGHHPDLYVAWGKCKVEIWTHKINGLTESDFYLAAKADREFEPFRAGA
jgi:4a-hydroxytetrahydrobiopterin dehydratase